MKRRLPSIRDLERDRPANVAVLPTAARQMVNPPRNRRTREAKAALQAEQGHRFGKRLPLPGEREAERRAEALQQAEPGALLALAILAELDLEARERVASRLAATVGQGRAHRAAADLAATACLNAGDASLLLRALAARLEKT